MQPDTEILRYYVREYRTQLVDGCDNRNCRNTFCASGSNNKKYRPEVAAVLALQLASMHERRYICRKLPRSGPALHLEDVVNSSATSFFHQVLRCNSFAKLFESFSENVQPRRRQAISPIKSPEPRPRSLNSDGKGRHSPAKAESRRGRRRGSSIQLTLQNLQAWVTEAITLEAPAKLIYKLQTVFSSPWSLSGSFWIQGMVPDDDDDSNYYDPNSSFHPTQSKMFLPTLDKAVFQEGLSLVHSEAMQKYRLPSILGNAVKMLVERTQKWCRELPMARQLHLLTIILQLAIFQKLMPTSVNLISYASLCSQALRSAPPVTLEAFVLQLSNVSTHDLKGMVDIFQNEIALIRNFVGSSPEIHAPALVLELLSKVNQIKLNRGEPALESSEFWNARFSTSVDFKAEHHRWKQQDFCDASAGRGVTGGSIIQYPFLLDPDAKYRILRIDAVVQMSQMFQDAFVNQAWVLQAKKLAIGHKPADMMTQAVRVATNPYLVFEIRRDHLMEDTLEQVSLSLKDLKKPLKIKYVGGGEEGVDMGGVQKEFFQLIMERVFDVRTGMFDFAEETGTFWINGSSLESEREFELVGILIGLAIYNGVILDMHLPLVLYKKLLGIPTNLIDLMESQPSLGNGLKALLDFQGDVEELDMCFQINENRFGHVATVDLVEDAENIVVNNQNRQIYVDLYVRHILDTSVAKQFKALHRGLHFVCGGPAIKLFSPDELELVVCGSPNLDFKELEAGTTYEGGFTKESEVIVWLWELVHAMDSENQRAFLHYVTGSGRVPIKGLGTLKMVIQQNGEHSDRLPTALTCFSRLLLPTYTNRERLKDRLFLAMEHGKGFGLA